MIGKDVIDNNYACSLNESLGSITLKNKRKDDEITHDFLKNLGVQNIKREGFFKGLKKK